MKSSLAIIPARGGSKRIPRKNIKNFLGMPVIYYSIEAALKSNLFDEVMVSTDDEEIAEISIKFGAKVPFIRSKINSDDFSGTGDVALEVLNFYSKIGKYFDYCCCIYAAAPLIQKKNLVEGFDLLKSSQYDVVLPICPFSSSIWRSYNLDTEQKCLLKNFPENEVIKRSQDLPDAYFDAGQFYWFKTSQFFCLENKNVFGTKKGGIILNEIEAQDIDSIVDWEMALMKHQILQNRLK